MDRITGYGAAAALSLLVGVPGVARSAGPDLGTAALAGSAGCSAELAGAVAGGGEILCATFSHASGNFEPPAPVTAADAVNPTGSAPPASASARAAYDVTLNYGWLGVQLGTTAGGTGPAGSSAWAHADLSFNDTLTVEPIVASGPVQLHYRLELGSGFSSLLSAGEAPAAAVLDPASGLFAGFQFGGMTVACLGLGASAGGGCAGASSGGVLEGFITVTSGEQVSLGASLTAQLGVTAQGAAGASASADAAISTFDGLRLYVQPVDATYRVATASGHDYALPVPEPASWALWAAGLLAMRARLRPLRLS